MKSKIWLIIWGALVASVLIYVGYNTYSVDPFFHYHKPDTDTYFYKLDNQRSQNDGIVKNFEYDAIITGTSMTENFKTSEMDRIYGTKSIKVSFSGGSYKEINDNLKKALEINPNLKTIVRCIDTGKLFDDKDSMRSDLGEYPTYLYDSNVLNDVKYLFNRDVVWNRTYTMKKDTKKEDFTSGITEFDDYSRWQRWYKFGAKEVIPNGVSKFKEKAPVHITEADKEIIRESIEQNVTSLAAAYPDVDFYYYLSPYSIVWWRPLVANGGIYRQIEAEQYAIELILEAGNIKLFSFSNCFDITADLNNYKDDTHYGEWINSLILRWMHDGKYQLTKDNYKDYIAEELDFYSSFDYMSLNKQTDYESDYYAAALCNQELTGFAPIDVLKEYKTELNLIGAQLKENTEEDDLQLVCNGSLSRKSGDEYSIEASLRDGKYVGAGIDLDNVCGYRYLVFDGRKLKDHGQPTVMIFDENGEKLGEISLRYKNIDNKWHKYVINIGEVKGKIKIVMHGGYIDDTGSPDSTYVFKNVMLY